MNEPFDQELSRALKDGVGGPAAGLEFTPAMQRRVLERIRAEAAAPQPVRTAPVIPRPLVWTAVAAAAFALALRLPLGGGMGGTAGKESAPISGSSTGASPQMNKPPAAPAVPAVPAPAPAAAAETAKAAASYDTAPAGAAAVAADAARTPSQTPAPQPAKTEQPAEEKGVTGFAMPGQPAADAPVTQSPGAGAAMARAGQPEAMTLAPESHALGAQSTAKSMAAPAETLRLAAAGNQTLELTQSELRSRDAAGAVRWTLPLERADLIAVAPDGRAAVGAGPKVCVVSAAGAVERIVEAAHGVGGLAWSAGGNLAVAGPEGVTVWQEGRPLYQVATAGALQVAFAPDGALAVLSRDSAGPRLALFGPDGARLMEASPALAGYSLAFTSDGTLAVANGQAFDRAGKAVWQAPMPRAAGAVAVGSLIVAWDSSTAAGLKGPGGTEAWRLSWPGGGGIVRAVADPAGRYVALLGVTDAGGQILVLDVGGNAVLTEKLPAPPIDVAFTGSGLLIAGQGGVTARALPK